MRDYQILAQSYAALGRPLDIARQIPTIRGIRIVQSRYQSAWIADDVLCIPSNIDCDISIAYSIGLHVLSRHPYQLEHDELTAAAEVFAVELVAVADLLMKSA